MWDIAAIIIFWGILFMVAFVFIPLWRKRHDEESGLYARKQDDNKLSVNYALKRLNCKVTWTKDHEDLIARYQYQSGHFRIRLEKNSPYIHLSYLFFFNTSLDDLELVRTICNQCNLNTETCRLVYSVNNETSVVDVHIVSSLLVTDATVKEVMERAMLNVFNWQTVFVRRYHEVKHDNDQALNHDGEKERASRTRELFLVRELEMMHQDEGPDWHVEEKEPMQLRQFLAATLGLTDIVPAKMMVFQDECTTAITTPDDILDYDITWPLIDGHAFACSSAVVRIDYYDPKDPVRLRHLTMDFEQEQQTADTLYFRVTLQRTPASWQAHTPVDASGEKQATSVLMGFDITPGANRLAEFKYLRKEAMAKRKDHAEEMTDDEKLIDAVQNPHVSYLLFRGKALYEEKRFYEAVYYLQEVYDTLKDIYEQLGENGLGAFFQTCFLLGASLANLGQYERASYYLVITLPLRSITYTEAYVNCLVNGNDFRALATINSLLFQVTPPASDGAADEDDDADDDVTAQHSSPNAAFISFLKRRKAYVLINQRKYDEAEKLLKQLLDDPENSDFALHELAYIQKNKQ